ncbi:hypothetical protein [Streptomyces mirabilis]|uniref:hypothetical protein n=1 Tax=Streptomyces mirabilis TaxID=68239 RepID=UPI0033FB7A2B
MDRDTGERRRVAEEIARLLNRLTAMGATPDQPAFIFRIIDAGTREVLDAAGVDDVTARTITSELAAMTDELFTHADYAASNSTEPSQPQPGPETPLSPEAAAQALYQALKNIGPDTDRALMATLRLPNGRYIGDVWLSTQDVQALSDGAVSITDYRNCPEEATRPPALDTSDKAVANVLAGFEALLKSEGGGE